MRTTPALSQHKYVSQMSQFLERDTPAIPKETAVPTVTTLASGRTTVPTYIPVPDTVGECPKRRERNDAESRRGPQRSLRSVFQYSVPTADLSASVFTNSPAASVPTIPTSERDIIRYSNTTTCPICPNRHIGYSIPLHHMSSKEQEVI